MTSRSRGEAARPRAVVRSGPPPVFLVGISLFTEASYPRRGVPGQPSQPGAGGPERWLAAGYLRDRPFGGLPNRPGGGPPGRFLAGGGLFRGGLGGGAGAPRA